jgi:FAD/FMN-containing dehydrogenase
MPQIAHAGNAWRATRSCNGDLMDSMALTERPLDLLGALQRRLGQQAVLIGDEVPARNCNDWSARLPQAPIAVVRPLDAAGVAQAIAACRGARLPFVPQGGLTGLCGGAAPEAGWVAISLERMVGIEEIDPASATMTVKAGTPLEMIQKAADEAGFFFPLDLGSRGSCAIGGNLSTNAGGNRVIRYGMTRELVLGLEVVLPDGTVITSLNKLLKNNAGYDLKHLFIGSEGTLGIITRVVLRLFPKPRSTMAALCALNDYPAVVALLEAARSSLGPLLSAFEVMWPDYWQVITARAGVRPPVEAGHGLYVLVEAQGTDEGIDAPRFEAWLADLMERGLLADAAVAQSLAQVRGFWAVRDVCSEFGQVLGPHISYDIGLAVARMDEFAGRCKAALAAGIAGCESVYYGHIGDGNLHLVAWVAGLSVERQPKEAMDAIIYGLVRDMGGSVSAEHGIGTLKKRWLGHARSEAEIALMRTLKSALDPDHLLNPGKVI